MRKIDAMVAERVMGWSSVGIWDSYHKNEAGEHVRDEPQPDSSYVGVGPNMIAEFKAGIRDATFGVIPAYSTDIAAAWEVIEKMRAKGWGYELFSMAGSTQHEATFGHPSDRTKDAAAETDSMPLSVCLAALRSVGVPEAEIQAAMEAKPCGD